MMHVQVLSGSSQPTTFAICQPLSSTVSCPFAMHAEDTCSLAESYQGG